MVCCGKFITLSKTVGGGTSWYYAFCECGKCLGAAHEDSPECGELRNEVDRLNQLNGHR
jgi:hypothetical protein